MRLLAHGGTSYSERHRIGTWSAIPREVLESTYGLPGDSMIYGLGILEDCLPFLILRVRQVTDIGRAYAYSLLLDPGRETWERFSWNAADLLRAILADPVSETLLAEPESLTAEDLIQTLSRLPPLQTDPTSRRPLTEITDDLACWIGTIFSDERAVFMPATLGFSTRPQPEELARLLYNIPQPTFRSGTGWLVGGSREHAESLGAGLVLDDGRGVASTATDYKERGREAAQAWVTISTRPEFKSVLSEHEVVPICEWRDTPNFSGSAVLARLKLLTNLLQSTDVPDELFGTLEQQLKGFPFLATEIRHAAHKLLLRGKRSLSHAQTALVLRNYYEQGLELEKIDPLRLDRETLIRMVVEHESRGASPRESITLPPEIGVEIFVRRLGTIPQYSEIPGLLVEASDFILKNFSGTRAVAWLTKVIEAVELRTKTTDSSLHCWDAFPRKPEVWRELSEVLKHVARQRARLRSTGWELEYLCFGKDDGGAQISAAGIGIVEGSKLVNRYLTEVRYQTDLAAKATEWLDKLAESSLRLDVYIADKVAVAESLGGKSWLPFRALWAAYSDLPDRKEFHSVFDIKVSPLAERERLRRELSQMLSEYPPRTKYPDLVRLQKLLVILPTDLMNALGGSLRRNVSVDAFALWIDGLLDVREPDLAAKEIVRYCLESKRPLPEGWLFSGFSERCLEELIDHLMFRGLSSDDEFYRHRCEEILGVRSTRLRKTLSRVFRDGSKESRSLENFVRRFAGHESGLVSLFTSFSVRLRKFVVGVLVSEDTEAFVKMVRDILNDVEAGVPLNQYRYAVLRYVRSADPHLRKKIVSWTLLTRSGLELLLDRHLQSGDELSDEGEKEELTDDETASHAAAPPPLNSPPSVPANQSAENTATGETTPEIFKSNKGSSVPLRPGFGKRVRSLLRRVLHEEPPPSLPGGDTNSSAPPVEENDS